MTRPRRSARPRSSVSLIDISCSASDNVTAYVAMAELVGVPLLT